MTCLLAAFEPSTFPVLSVYLNTQPDRHGRTPDVVPYLHREFKALARTFMQGSPELHSFDNHAERILSYASDKIDPAAHGIAIFACWGAEKFFEGIQLTTPFGNNHVSADDQPHLYGLAEVDERYPRYAAVLADTNTACIYVFGLGQVQAAEQVTGTKVHRVKVGGWSQARYQLRAVNAHHEHAKEVMERLARVVREDRISHIILAGDQVVIPLLQERRPRELIPLVEVMKLDIHAPETDVLTATLATLQRQEVRTAAEWWTGYFSSIAAGNWLWLARRRRLMPWLTVRWENCSSVAGWGQWSCSRRAATFGKLPCLTCL